MRWDSVRNILGGFRADGHPIMQLPPPPREDSRFLRKLGEEISRLVVHPNGGIDRREETA